MAVGRPTKLTREVLEEIVRNMASCAHPSIAAGCANVSKRTFHVWMRRGKAEPDGIYGEFRHRILMAEKSAEMRLAALIAKAAAASPDHAKWMLTHRFKRRWAETSKIQLSGKVDTGLAVMTDEELAKSAERAAKVLRTGADEG
jgi:hypothetical protein